MKSGMESGGHSELIGLNVYTTPTVSWIKEPAPSLPAPREEGIRGRGVPRAGGKGAAKRSGVKMPRPRTAVASSEMASDIRWEIHETDQGTELTIFVTPAAALGGFQEFRHTGPDGRSTLGDVARKAMITQKLAEGPNEIALTKTDGSRIVLCINVHRLHEDVLNLGGASGGTDILRDAEGAVVKHQAFARSSATKFIAPCNGLLSLGELKSLLLKAERIGAETLIGTTTLILGETGTGKDLLAHFIYSKWVEMLGQMAHKVIPDKVPFVATNGASLGGEDMNLQISRLFGCAPGYPNAGDRGFLGYFLRAAGYEWVQKPGKPGRGIIDLQKVNEAGLLFLDEVGDIPLETQALLLRNIQDGMVEPLGWEPVPASPKVVLATHKDITDSRIFRPDLKHRVQYQLEMPPLRERMEIIPHLVYFFTKEYFEKREELFLSKSRVFEEIEEQYRKTEKMYRETDKVTAENRLVRDANDGYLKKKDEFLKERAEFYRQHESFLKAWDAFRLSKESAADLEWDSEALVALSAYSWPGNIRELGKNIEEILASQWDPQETHIPLDSLPDPVRENYWRLKQLISQRDRETIEKLCALTQDLLKEAWKDLPTELFLPGKDISEATRKKIAEHWAKIINQKMDELKDWLMHSQGYDVPAETDRNCMSYLRAWLESTLETQKPQKAEKKRSREIQATAKKIVVETKNALTVIKGMPDRVPLSNAAEKMLHYGWIKDHYAVVSRFWGISIRALNH